MRGTGRLLKAVRKIYGEEFGINNSDIQTHFGLDKSSVPNDNNGRKEQHKPKEESVIIKYIKNHVQGGFHSLFSTLVKSASALTEDQFLAVIPTTWELLMDPDIQVSWDVHIVGRLSIFASLQPISEPL